MNISKNSISLFNIIRQSPFIKKSTINSKKIITKLQNKNNDFTILTQKIFLLQKLVIKKGNNIKPEISKILFYLASGNNDYSLKNSFYSSKLFIDVIHTFNISLSEYYEDLIVFIHKIISDKLITQYLSNQENLFGKFLLFFNNPKISKNAIQISESLLVNKVVSLNNIFKTINSIYNTMIKKNQLDLLCRVFGILLYDNNKIDIKDLIRKKENLRKIPISKQIVENQSISINLKNFLENLVQKLKFSFEDVANVNQDNPNYLRINLFTEQNINNKKTEILIYPQNLTDNLNINGKILNKKETLSLLYLNIFEKFNPSYKNIPKNESNIFNSYIQLTKNISQMNNNFKIKDNRKQFINIYKNSSFQVQMLFTLSTLLSRERKTEIQDKLNNLNIMNYLSPYLDYIEWGNIFNSNNDRPIFNTNNNQIMNNRKYHGQGCCCDCDCNLKLQYLSLIYSFCSRDKNNFENKLNLLSEKDILGFLNEGYIDLIKDFLKEKLFFYQNKNNKISNSCNNLFYSIIDKLKIEKMEEINIEKTLIFLTDPKLINQKICYYNKFENEIGLLQKLIFKYIQECYFSTAKICLLSIFESILKGNNTFYQSFFISSGLFPCLLYDIIYPKNEQSKIIKSSFDLLGELIQFNKGNFYILDYFLFDERELTVFYNRIINEKYIFSCSNFLRSVILSTYFFDKNDKKNNFQEEQFFTKKNKICSFFKSKYESIFFLLISKIEIKDINQQNLNTINLILLFFVIEYLNENIITFFKDIRIKYKGQIKGIFQKFINIIKIWKDYYSFRTKECLLLQNTTNIPYHTFQKLTDLLLKEDEKEICSLYYKY